MPNGKYTSPAVCLIWGAALLFCSRFAACRSIQLEVHMKQIAALMLGSLVASAASAAGFTLSSADIAPNATLTQNQVFNGFGCSGKNISPALSWSGAPAGTQSYALTVYDPDAPTGSGWWHWVVINIPPNVTELPANAGAEGGANLPKGASNVRIDYGVAAWGGVCPPEGDKPHRYIFTVHALKTR